MKERKRIVFVVTNDLSYDQRMHRICSTLQAAGYQVELIGRVRKNSVPLASKTFKQKRLRCWVVKGPLFYAEYNIRLFFTLLSHPAQMFGAVDLDTALAVTLAGMLKRRITVFDAHEHFTEVPEVERRKTIKAIWHAIGKWCIPKFKVRFTVGEELAGVLEKEYHAPFSVVRNVPVLHHAEILPRDQRRNLIIYQGALNEGRGLEHAITAMQFLPEMELRLIGEGDLSESLRALVDRLGLASRVEFMGFVLPQDIPALTVHALIGLNLLEARSKSYYYSLANKFFDYMHAGIPSLNMAFPEYKKIISQYPVGICIENLSDQAIAEAIRKMLTDNNQVEIMLEACKRARELYCWQTEEKALLSLITPLLA